ncbi:unnamed protein product [Somion occarium]|uniref:F-box domain-containing protein n=1 Tax=Somion occarium TaxID=3059160 RepID=A0ABP1DWF8_9APHY
MHRIFYVSEILDNVFHRLEYRDVEVGKQTLAGLARTCRAFENVALGVLWEEQAGLVPLARCLGDAVQERWKPGLSPSDGLTGSRRQNEKKILYCRRLPTVSEWKRMHRYAKLVKTFRDFGIPYPGQDQAIDTSILLAIFYHCPGRLSLFSNLRELNWPLLGVGKDDIPFVTRFFGPKLEQVNFIGRGDMELDLPIMDHLLSCPLLTTVSLCCRSRPVVTLPIRDLLTTSFRLRYFFCKTPLDSVHVQALAALPSLQVVDIHLSDTAELPPLLLAQCDHAFPALRSLTLHVRDVVEATRFIELSPLPRLTDLSLAIRDQSFPSSPTLIQTLGEVMARQFSTTTYETFEISSQCPMRLPWDASKAIQPFMLQPFLKFQAMSSFKLDAQWCYDLDDAFMDVVASAWRQLHSLRLDPNGSWPSHRVCKLTITGLLPLVQRCPCISDIEGHFEGRVPEMSDTDRPGNGYEAQDVMSINVGDAEVPNTRAVAAFLSDVFPQLDFIFCWEDEETNRHAGRWGKVVDLAKSYIMVRQQMKTWYEKDEAGSETHGSETDTSGIS